MIPGINTGGGSLSADWGSESASGDAGNSGGTTNFGSFGTAQKSNIDSFVMLGLGALVIAGLWLLKK